MHHHEPSPGKDVPQEIPNRENPDKNYPEKDPQIDPNEQTERKVVDKSKGELST